MPCRSQAPCSVQSGREGLDEVITYRMMPIQEVFHDAAPGLKVARCLDAHTLLRSDVLRLVTTPDGADIILSPSRLDEPFLSTLPELRGLRQLLRQRCLQLLHLQFRSLKHRLKLLGVHRTAVRSVGDVQHVLRLNVALPRIIRLVHAPAAVHPSCLVHRAPVLHDEFRR